MECYVGLDVSLKLTAICIVWSSTTGTQPPMIADELRRRADVFTDLLELQAKVGRDPSERQAARERSDPRRRYAQRPTPPRPRGQTNEVEP
jgi:hypothetical protein